MPCFLNDFASSAAVESRSGHAARALTYLEEARGLAADLDDSRRAAFLMNLAIGYREVGDFEAAFERALAAGKPSLLELPVDPERTIFRIGSVGKVFTWTAVMQLVEQGKLDLDADINTYLDFRIPDTYPQPITLKHLMTHTPGFEDNAFGFASTTPEGMEPIGEWLANNIPARVWPAGEVPAYSNYGATLAGYIVERVSGMPYEDYIEQHILDPLAMTKSTPRQPPPAALEADMALGYEYQDNAFQPQGFEYMTIVPAGSISSTARTSASRPCTAHS